MGTKLFGVDIAKTVKNAMASGLPKARLLKESVGALDEANPTAEPAVSYRAYPCRGFEDVIEKLRPGTQVRQSGRAVLILGDTLPAGIVPEPGDRIELLGETLEIVGDGVTSDPARATYVCSCRG
jgi:hypothetical protein